MSEAKNIETVINEELPVAFKKALGLDVIKVNVKSYYSDEKKTVLIVGKICCEDFEKYPLWDSVDIVIGKAVCKSRSKGAFAIGELKGKRIFIENVEIELNLEHFPSIRRTLNLHKIKGGVEECFKESVKGRVYETAQGS
jgi:hypothetical protein